MEKLKKIISLILLAGLTIIIGVLTAFNRKPLTPRHEYPLQFTAGILAMALVLGLMFWGVYTFCKKHEIGDPFKIAFWVYAFFGFCFFGIGAYQFKDSVNQRDNYEFMEYNADMIEILVHDRVVEELELSKHKSIDLETVVEIHECALTLIGNNNEIIEPMRKAKNMEAFLKKDKEVQFMLDFCIRDSKEN